MSYIAVTNTFANGTGQVVDANKFNTNFTDITTGLSAGAADINVGTVQTGAEKLKTLTYTYVLQAGEAAGGTYTFTGLPISVTYIRGMMACGYNVGNNYTLAGPTDIWINCAQGGSVAIAWNTFSFSDGDTMMITIIMAV